MVAFAYLVFFAAPLWAFAHVLTRRATPMAVSQAIVGAWLAMPLLRIDMPSLPDLDKEMLVGLAVTAGVLFAGRRPARGGGFSLCELPLLGLCLAPLGSSLANGLGLFDGVSAVLRHLFVFGLPYAIGRMVFVDAAAIGAFARAIAVGALCYLPAILFESRMAPQLHEWVFGLPGRVGWETVDFYGPLRWKPSVFLQSPLELTLLMGVGFLGAWWTGVTSKRAVIGVTPIRWATRGALLAVLMGKSLGGVSLTLFGAAALRFTRYARSPFVVVLLLAIVPLYISTRASGAWDGMSFVRFLQENVSERRAESFLTRIENENILVEKALEQPLFGWGGWGRNRVYDEEGKDISITDGFWVILLGVNGWAGLGSWLALVAMPFVSILARWRSGAARVCDGPVLWAMVAVVLHSVDSIANAMLNPSYYVLMGALVAVGRSRGYVESSPGALADAAAHVRAPSRRAPLQPRRPVAPR